MALKCVYSWCVKVNCWDKILVPYCREFYYYHLKWASVWTGLLWMWRHCYIVITYFRYRGWHKTRIKKGNHYILIAPSFENSDVGRQLDKLRRNASRDGKLDRFVHRITTKETVQPDKPKSRATKRNLEPIDVNKVDDSFSNDSSRPPMIMRESTRIYDAEDTPLSRRRARDESAKDGRTNLVTPRKGSNDVTLKPDLKNSLDEFNE